MTENTLNLSREDLSDAVAQLAGPSGRIDIDPDRVEADLARLVLAIVAFLRELMELQAIRRMENGTLSEEEEERVGMGLMKAETAIHDVARKFGLKPSDLSLDLGALGRTI